MDDEIEALASADDWRQEEQPRAWSELLVMLAAGWNQPGPQHRSSDDGERYLAAARAVARGPLS